MIMSTETYPLCQKSLLFYPEIEHKGPGSPHLSDCSQYTQGDIFLFFGHQDLLHQKISQSHPSISPLQRGGEEDETKRQHNEEETPYSMACGLMHFRTYQSPEEG
jgi:hypothetical protein